MRRAALVVLAACHAVRPAPAPGDGPIIEPSWMDRSVDPCDDFYQYACGGWLARVRLAPEQSWDGAFLDRGAGDRTLRRILDREAAARSRLGNLWAACLGDDGSPDVLRAELAAVRVATPAELARTVAHLHLTEATPLFQVAAAQDAHAPDTMILEVNQGGLGISVRVLSWIDDNRDYYLAAKHAHTRALYAAHVERMLALAGERDAAAAARGIVELETALARGYLSNADTDEPAKQDHPMDVARLAALAPHFPWRRYFAALGIQPSRVNVQSPDFLRALDGVLAHTGAAQLGAYLRWQLVHAHAQALGPAFAAEDFRFRAQALTGQRAPPPRWSVCLEDVNRLAGDALGRAYVKQAIDEKALAEARALGAGIRAAFARRLERAPWLDARTRARALDKLAKVRDAIGYPARSGDLRAPVDRRSYLADVLAAAEARARRELSWIGAPADRAALSWRFMHPQTFDAMYDPQLNQMLFPAAILRPPFFVPGLGAGNYARIGWVMGHELTHGFDRAGRRYDGAGRLGDWWTAATAQAFDERAACFVGQYASIALAPGVHEDGEQTLKENIADNNAMELAWAAWKASGGRDDRRFFVAVTQGFCAVARDELLRTWAATRPVSWWRLRATVPLMNLPAFAETFACRPGAPMAPARRCALY